MSSDDPETALVPRGEGLPERLRPVPHGWQIRRADGHKTWQLAPPRAQPFVRALSWTPYVMTLGGLLALQIFTHNLLWLYFLLGKGGVFKVGLVAAAGAKLSRFSGRVTAWYLRRFAGLQLTVGSLRKRREGAPVRLRGTVRPEASFVSPVSGQPTVFTQFEVRAGERRVFARGFDEVRGIDFVVDVDGGETVRVSAADAFITDAPGEPTSTPHNAGLVAFLPSCESTCREARIAPGDRVEMIGILSREFDEFGEQRHGRNLPSQYVLRGTRRLPLLLRRLPAETPP